MAAVGISILDSGAKLGKREIGREEGGWALKPGAREAVRVMAKRRNDEEALEEIARPTDGRIEE